MTIAETAERTVSVHRLSKTFTLGGERVHALDDITLVFEPGVLTVVAGPSGSGKTTLLSVLAGHDRPDSGEMSLPGGPGAHSIGYIPQALALLEELTVWENVELPVIIAGGVHRSSTDDLLAALDLSDLADRFPAQLSGGEQQRVAVARALRAKPPVLLADEPTGHQDSLRAQMVVDVLRKHAQAGNVVLMSSHDESVIRSADRIMWLRDGKVEQPLPSV